jgi:hypothetical protein
MDAITKAPLRLMDNFAHQIISHTAHGLERQPVIVIDNFVSDPERIIADAAMLSFRPIGAHYPGMRAVVPRIMVAQFLQGLSGLIAETFGLDFPFVETECWYSLVTTPPEALAPIQRLPHFDSVDPGRIAVLHFLAREQGGTSFFRHRETQFESINAGRLNQYVAAIDADAERFGLPDAAYIAGDTPMFERIAHYNACFNRAIIYRGNTLHCADIPSGMALSSDPYTGRLTVNTFIHARAT